MMNAFDYNQAAQTQFNAQINLLRNEIRLHIQIKSAQLFTGGIIDELAVLDYEA
jgi:hypothetical protein